jgi:hypothetical protein
METFDAEVANGDLRGVAARRRLDQDPHHVS